MTYPKRISAPVVIPKSVDLAKFIKHMDLASKKQKDPEKKARLKEIKDEFEKLRELL